MADFFMVATRSPKQGIIEIYPKFLMRKTKDLMIRGGDFYAVWVPERGLWSTDEQDVIDMIDLELDRYREENEKRFVGQVRVLHMWDAESGMIDMWHRYCQKQSRDSYVMLDERLIFSNHETVKEDYASKRLPYPLEACDTPAYEKIISTLYSPEERHKIEWSIGAIVSGDSKKIQKFIVLYGAPGTGKSTILNIIQDLFDGYTAVFDAKALGSSSNAFALEAFRSNPLVAIQHDGDLSRIEDNTRLNSLVSHEYMTVNEKFKSTYTNRFKCFLYLGTNKPVKISDARSGLLRRLIDVTPSGNKLSSREYKAATKQVKFELGGIAQHCLDVYLEDPGYYDDYVPINMMGASNDFYNFVSDAYPVFKKDDGTTLKSAWEMYKIYVDEAKVAYSFSQRVFKEELKDYFREYKERYELPDGTRVRSYFKGFKTEKFEAPEPREVARPGFVPPEWLLLNSDEPSPFDISCCNCPAQYASSQETPMKKWDEVKAVLKNLDTSRLHYVKPEEHHIVIDFDLRGSDGAKNLEENIRAAASWPETYAEVSKGGSGLHLHYIYQGDPSTLAPLYAPNIEVKTFLGNGSLRRKLTRHNDLPIASIASGLPTKGEKKMVNFDSVKSEKSLRVQIQRNLNKEIHPATKPSVDFIKKILDDAYESGLHYDVTDMRGAILAFAAGSTNQSEACIKLVNQMKFKSEDPSDYVENEEAPIVFFDVEIFPNLFLVEWKLRGPGNPVVKMYNPRPSDIEPLLRYRLIGFNNRQYDNHMLYACLLGYTVEQLYNLSAKIIGRSKNAFFSEAYNLSYTDIYDFSSKKQSLKKFEIDLGIHHHELGLPWDQPVPEELWPKVAEYCEDDVLATEAVFEDRQADFTARKILAKITGGSVNDTTNTLSTKLIFGNNRKPQAQFNYRNMGEMTSDAVVFEDGGDQYTVFDGKGRPIFPGYKYAFGKSTYRGEEVGEGGYVYAEPGTYGNVALLDIASMHPSSIIAEELFGPAYTKRFAELKDARVAIKHKDFDTAKTMLEGALSEFIEAIENETADYAPEDLAQALKIVINSVYGLTAASFENPFRDPRNRDNIVAKRGALFMVNLKHEVQRMGYTVAHIKTDSIKIPDATPEIIKFVMDYGKMYGYTFEHEATYDRMCLANNAVYIAKYSTEDICDKLYGYVPSDIRKHPGEWTATGAQFAVPYVYKTLFTKEPIEFEDLCETKSVKQGALYLDMNETLEDVTPEETELAKLRTKYKKKLISDEEFKAARERLEPIIASGHNYIFVGRVGQFTPIKPGCGGGILVRSSEEKTTGETQYPSAAGATGYRWKESEVVRELEQFDDVDIRYYEILAGDAKLTLIENGCDYEWFVSDDPYIPATPSTDEAYEHDAFAVR